MLSATEEECTEKLSVGMDAAASSFSKLCGIGWLMSYNNTTYT